MVVFAALVGVSYEDVLRDLPDADVGTITVDGWKQWLNDKGYKANHLNGCPLDVFPCAHLVAPVDDRRYCHWIYRDELGDVHDPSPVFSAMPADDPRMKNLEMYQYKVLTLSISK